MALVEAYPQAWKEARRRLALDLKGQGYCKHEIAKMLQVSNAAVSQWMKAEREHGEDGLQARPRPGAPTKLTKAQLQQVPEFLLIRVTHRTGRQRCRPGLFAKVHVGRRPEV